VEWIGGGDIETEDDKAHDDWLLFHGRLSFGGPIKEEVLRRKEKQGKGEKKRTSDSPPGKLFGFQWGFSEPHSTGKFIERLHLGGLKSEMREEIGAPVREAKMLDKCPREGVRKKN